MGVQASAVCGPGTYKSPVLLPGLRALYRLDGDTSDSSGNGYDLTMTNAAADPYSEMGVNAVDPALKIKDSTTVLEYAASASAGHLWDNIVGGKPVTTLAVWLKDMDLSANIHGLFSLTWADGLWFRLDLYATGKLGLTFYGGGWDARSFYPTCATAVDWNAQAGWWHVVFTSDGTNIKMRYRNQADSAYTTCDLKHHINTDTSITTWYATGSINSASLQTFKFLSMTSNIKLDDARVYNRALSDSEINKLFNEKNPCKSCPAGSTTLAVGAESKSACVCQSGSYSPFSDAVVAFNPANEVFDGSRVETLNSVDMNFQSTGITIVLKVKFERVAPIESDKTWEHVFNFGNGQSGNIFLSRYAATTGFRFEIDNDNGDSKRLERNGGGYFQYNDWCSVYLRYSESRGMTINIDGFTAYQEVTGTITDRTFANVYIGKSAWTNPNFLGQIAGLYAFNRYLSDAEAEAVLATIQTGALDDPLHTACVACPAGQTTLSPGASRLSECVCESGSYHNKTKKYEFSLQYRFENNLQDEQGSNHLSVHGTYSFDSNAKEGTYAMKLPGDSYLESASDIDTAVTNELSFWLWLDRDTGRHLLFAIGDKFMIQIFDDNGTKKMYLSNTNGCAETYVIQEFSWSHNQWYHFRVVIESTSKWYCYVDGTNILPSNLDGTCSGSTLPSGKLFIGRTPDNIWHNSYYLEGMIDDFTIRSTDAPYTWVDAGVCQGCPIGTMTLAPGAESADACVCSVGSFKTDAYDTNLIAHYGFDGDTRDLQNPGNVATLTGNGGIAYLDTTHKIFGSHSVKLTNDDGLKTYLLIPQFQLDTSLTISFWFRWDITSLHDSGWTKLFYFSGDVKLYASADSSVSGDGEALYFVMYDQNNNRIEYKNSDMFYFSNNVWYHVSWVVNKNSEMRGFVDGEYVPRTNTAELESGKFPLWGASANMNNNRIGTHASYDDGRDSIDGHVDEFRLYNTALSDSAVRALYEARGAPCMSCPSGMTSPAGSTSSDACVCQAGSFTNPLPPAVLHWNPSVVEETMTDSTTVHEESGLNWHVASNGGFTIVMKAKIDSATAECAGILDIASSSASDASTFVRIGENCGYQHFILEPTPTSCKSEHPHLKMTWGHTYTIVLKYEKSTETIGLYYDTSSKFSRTCSSEATMPCERTACNGFNSDLSNYIAVIGARARSDRRNWGVQGKIYGVYGWDQVLTDAQIQTVIDSIVVDGEDDARVLHGGECTACSSEKPYTDPSHGATAEAQCQAPPASCEVIDVQVSPAASEEGVVTSSMLKYVTFHPYEYRLEIRLRPVIERDFNSWVAWAHAADCGNAMGVTAPCYPATYTEAYGILAASPQEPFENPDNYNGFGSASPLADASYAGPSPVYAFVAGERNDVTKQAITYLQMNIGTDDTDEFTCCVLPLYAFVRWYDGFVNYTYDDAQTEDWLKQDHVQLAYQMRWAPYDVSESSRTLTFSATTTADVLVISGSEYRFVTNLAVSGQYTITVSSAGESSFLGPGSFGVTSGGGTAYVGSESALAATSAYHIDGGGWMLVRRSSGSTFLDTRDFLTGTVTIGTYTTNERSSSSFTIPFSHLLYHDTEFMFVTGDGTDNTNGCGSEWMIISIEQLGGNVYDDTMGYSRGTSAYRNTDAARTFRSGTGVTSGYFYNRNWYGDPQVAIGDYDGNPQMYAGYNKPMSTNKLTNCNGLNVFIRTGQKVNFNNTITGVLKPYAAPQIVVQYHAIACPSASGPACTTVTPTTDPAVSAVAVAGAGAGTDKYLHLPAQNYATKWRVSNAGVLTWRPAISEIYLYSDIACSQQVSVDTTVVTVEAPDPENSGYTPEKLFDGTISSDSQWRPKCCCAQYPINGVANCAVGQVSFTLTFPQPERIQCVKTCGNLGWTPDLNVPDECGSTSTGHPGGNEWDGGVLLEASNDGGLNWQRVAGPTTASNIAIASADIGALFPFTYDVTFPDVTTGEVLVVSGTEFRHISDIALSGEYTVTVGTDTSVVTDEAGAVVATSAGGTTYPLPRWVLGIASDSCDNTCAAVNMQCDAAAQTALDTQAKLNQIVLDEFGITCKDGGDRNYAGTPFVQVNSNSCMYYSDVYDYYAHPQQTSSVCNVNVEVGDNHRPVCRCVPATTGFDHAITGVLQSYSSPQIVVQYHAIVCPSASGPACTTVADPSVAVLGVDKSAFACQQLTSPPDFSWQRAYDLAVANGNLLPTTNQALAYCATSTYFSTSLWIPTGNPSAKDWVSCSTAASSIKSHVEHHGYPNWGDGTTASYASGFCEITTGEFFSQNSITGANAKYITFQVEWSPFNITFPDATTGSALLISGTKYLHVPTLALSSGTYTVILPAPVIVGQDDATFDRTDANIITIPSLTWDVNTNTGFTVITKLRIHTQADWQGIFNFGSGNGAMSSGYDEFRLNTYDSSRDSLQFIVSNGVTLLLNLVTTDGTISLNQWHTVVIQYNSNSKAATLDIDGTVATGTMSAAMTDRISTFNTIGKAFWNQIATGDYFDGDIAGFYAWDYYLSATEVEQFTAGIAISGTDNVVNAGESKIVDASGVEVTGSAGGTEYVIPQNLARQCGINKNEPCDVIGKREPHTGYKFECIVSDCNNCGECGQSGWHGNSGLDEWVRIDLETTLFITKISIRSRWNSADEKYDYAERADGIQVHIGDGDGTLVKGNSYPSSPSNPECGRTQLQGWDGTAIGVIDTGQFVLECNMQGRYVDLRWLENSGIPKQATGVQVFGYKSTAFGPNPMILYDGVNSSITGTPTTYATPQVILRYDSEVCPSDGCTITEQDPVSSTHDFAASAYLDKGPISDGTTDQYMLFKYDPTQDASGQTTYDVTFSDETECDILIVAGGGAGGHRISSSSNGGSGGGAGGLIFQQNVKLTGSVSISVGNGGVNTAQTERGEQGKHSSVGAITAIGGGGGGSRKHDGDGDANGIPSVAQGGDGGSGGGSCFVDKDGNYAYEGGKGTPGQGHDGGKTKSPGIGAGGGGAGGRGGGINGVENHDGGIGLYEKNSINFKTHFNIPSGIGHSSGGQLYFAGGGGGGEQGDAENQGAAGLGGGGDGGDSADGEDATDHTGGGGGGASNAATTYSGGNGGSGVVVIRYKMRSKITCEDPTDPPPCPLDGTYVASCGCPADYYQTTNAGDTTCTACPDALIAPAQSTSAEHCTQPGKKVTFSLALSGAVSAAEFTPALRGRIKAKIARNLRVSPKRVTIVSVQDARRRLLAVSLEVEVTAEDDAQAQTLTGETTSITSAVEEAASEESVTLTAEVTSSASTAVVATCCFKTWGV